MYDTGSDWVKDRVGFVLGITNNIKQRNSSPGQLFARMKGMNNRNERTRANVPQTALVLDSGATIHFFSNERMMKKSMTVMNQLRILWWKVLESICCWGTMR